MRASTTPFANHTTASADNDITAVLCTTTLSYEYAGVYAALAEGNYHRLRLIRGPSTPPFLVLPAFGMGSEPIFCHVLGPV